jgi:MFS family permease
MTDAGQKRLLGVWLLGLGETVIWAYIFYIFAGLLLTWEETLGWQKADLTLGLTVAILTAAAVSPWAGRRIDEGLGRWVLGGGAFLGCLALAGLSFVNDPWTFLGVWAVIGAAQGCCLYEPCFSVVTRAFGEKARPAITKITLIAGLASTLCFLTTAWMLKQTDWRTGLLVFAVIAAVVAVPSLFYGTVLVEKDKPRNRPSNEVKALNTAAVQMAIRRPQFWMLAMAFPFMALNHGILLNHIMPILTERQITRETAILVASTIGPMQVFGRVMLMLFEKRVQSLTMSGLAFLIVMIASMVLLTAGGEPELAFLFAVLQGGAYGLTSILKPALTAEFLGRDNFGSIAGWLALPYLAAFAFAPHLGALIWELGGYGVVISATAALAALGVISICALAMVGRAQRRKSV